MGTVPTSDGSWQGPGWIPGCWTWQIMLTSPCAIVDLPLPMASVGIRFTTHIFARQNTSYSHWLWHLQSERPPSRRITRVCVPGLVPACVPGFKFLRAYNLPSDLVRRPDVTSPLLLLLIKVARVHASTRFCIFLPPLAVLWVRSCHPDFVCSSLLSQPR